MKLDDKQLETLLNSLPRAEISKKADKAFYAKLNALAKGRFSEEGLEEAPIIRNFFAFPRLAFVGAFASLLLVVGGTVWAYQPSTTRGELMYPWKQTVEKVELAFAFSDMQKVDAHLNFSDRRLEEAQNIVGKSSSLALFLQTAFADEGEVELTDSEQENLEATLEDMRSEVTKASEIVVTRVTAPEKAKQAIERIENASNQHIEILNNLERRAANRAKQIVRIVADDEDERLANIMQAHEEVKQALEKRERQVKLTINIRRERLSELKDQFNDEMRQRRVEEVRQNFTGAMQRFEVMPLNIKQEFTAKIEKAKESLRMGRFGMAEGLSRVMDMRRNPPPGEPLGSESFDPTQPLDEMPKPESENSDKKDTALPKPDMKLPQQLDVKLPQQGFSKPPDAKFPEKPAQEKPEFINPNQPKPILINKNELNFQPDQQKPQQQEPPAKPELMPPPLSPNMMKGMERVDNLIHGLEQAGQNFEESK